MAASQRGGRSTQFDVIVVGAGVEGSATAYQLISNGARRVLLLEQVSSQLKLVMIYRPFKCYIYTLEDQ